MKILFIHQDIPGQFEPLIQSLLAEGGHAVRGLGLHFRPHFATAPIPGLQLDFYPPPPPSPTPDGVPPEAVQALATGRQVADCLARWQNEGYCPDVIVSNIAFGEAIYLREVYPHTPILGYCEYYFHSRDSNADFGRTSPLSLASRCLVQTANLTPLLGMTAMDLGVSPTHWQKNLFPPEFHRKISVIHEGVDTERLCPDAAATVTLPGGQVLDRSTLIVTYATRNLEPYRGFDVFMRAVEKLCRRRQDCQFIIAGGDEISYSPALPPGETYRQHLLNELDIDPNRVHFVGRRPYADYIRILQVSSVHVYLSYPFVLSWSLPESMAAGCVIVGSDTAPVRELLQDGRNGWLVSFFADGHLADRIEAVLDHPTGWRSLGVQARADVQAGYERRDTLRHYRALIHRVIESRSV